MSGKGPGKNARKGLSMIELFRVIPDDSACEQWFCELRWPDGIVYCPACGSRNVQTGARHCTMPYRCREVGCAKKFSVRTGTALEHPKLGYQVWVFAFYQKLTNVRGVSSMKLHRDLDITQGSSWFLGHRIRESWNDGAERFMGPVEADETYVGGQRNRMHAKRRKALGVRGTAAKMVVAGVKDRTTNRVSAAAVPDIKTRTLTEFLHDRTTEQTVVYTDELRSYNALRRERGIVAHGVKQFVDGQAHTPTGLGRSGRWSNGATREGHLLLVVGRAPQPLHQ